MMAEITKSSLWGEKREKQEPKDLNPLKIWSFSCYCSVAKSCPTLWSHGLQHIRFPCPSLSPEICSNSCPLSRWCHRTISSSVALFFFCLQSFPASGSLLMSQLFSSGGQSIGTSASAISPFNEYSGLIFFSTDWFDLLAIQGTLKSLPQQCISKASILQCSAFFMVQLLHPYMITGKPQLWLYICIYI